MRGQPLAAIAGLGTSAFSRQFTAPAWRLAVDAIHAAIADAGLGHRDVDGLLINKSPIAPLDALPMELADSAGLKDLRLQAVMEAEGSSFVQMIQQASLAVDAGMARHVVCVFADTPLAGEGGGGAAFAVAMPLMGRLGLEPLYGCFGAVAAYALAAQRYLARHELDTDALGAVAVAQRQWAERNPDAFLRKPMDLEAYRRAPWVAEPLRVPDCAYPVNGAVAVLVTDCGRARALGAPPVHVLGIGQGHAGTVNRRGFDPETETGASIAAHAVYDSAGLGPEDIDACAFYDAFSICVLEYLEAYGFCPPGEAAGLVASGATAPGGRLPVNTGGGHLSSYYLQGATPVHEAVVQLRGAGGARQVPDLRRMLVTGHGGRMQFHAALILGNG